MEVDATAPQASAVAQASAYQVPGLLLNKWLNSDVHLNRRNRIALVTRGNRKRASRSSASVPHALPHVVYSSNPSRDVNFCAAILLGVDEQAKRSISLVIHGPDGSDIGKPRGGREMTISVVYDSLSSFLTRVCTMSPRNGWRCLYCVGVSSDDGSPIFEETDLLRTKIGGCGWNGFSEERLLWFYEIWHDIFCHAASDEEGENIAMQKLRALVPVFDESLITDEVICECPSSDPRARMAFATIALLQSKAVHVSDKKVRSRIRERPRQSKQTAREKETRSSIGRRQDPDVEELEYDNEFQVEANGMIRVKCSSSRKQSASSWIPLDVFNKKGTVDGLSRFLAMALMELEQRPFTFEARERG